MLPVSENFQKTIRKPRRKVRIELSLIVWYPTYKLYTFGDEAVIADTLTITDQFSGGKFCFGSVFSRSISVKIDTNKIEGLDPFNVNFNDAVLHVSYYLTIPNGDDPTVGTEEELFLGTFFINSNQTKRKRSVLEIFGSDCMTKLDVPVTEQKTDSVYNVAQSVLWGNAGFNLATSQSEMEAFPNGSANIAFETSQIQTVRDALMWIGDFTGTFVRQAYGGAGQRVEFVQIPTKYTKGGTSGNFDLETFKADNGSIIPANVRFKTDYTDTSIRPVKFLTRRSGKSISVIRSWTAAPDTLFGTIEFDENPLTKQYFDEYVETCLTNVADYAEELRFCPFNVQFNGNPAIQCGDFVYLEPGGGIDDDKFIHYGIVTYYKWKYRGASEIRCATDIAGERPQQETVSRAKKVVQRRAVSQPMALANDNEEDETPEPMPVKPKSQIEKRLDGLEGKSMTELVGNFGGKYVFKWTNPYYLAAFDGNGKEMFKLSVLPFSVEKGNSHITLGNDYIEIKNAETRGREFSFYIHENGQTRITDSSGNDVFSIIPAGGLMEYKVGSQSFQVWLNTGEIKMNGKTVWAPWMA